MLSVDEALALILQTVKPLPPRRVPLAEALGCVLAEEVASDVDSPPHDKSVVDGYAIRFDDLSSGHAELRVLEEVTAGEVPQHTVESGTATRIMTGAPLPVGADAVVMVEKSSLSGDRVTLDDARAKLGQNIVRRGTSMKQGDVVLRPQDIDWLKPAHVGLLAEVGRTSVFVTEPHLRVAVLSTGNELVPADALPGPGAIRNSNGPMLAALVAHHGDHPVDLGVARDDRDDLKSKIAAGLQADALILSGGVSAGVLDLVPGILAELGVKQVFHKVSLKPGKPIWFGAFTAPDGTVKPVFGLPGNPVSSFVCYQLFVFPALMRLQSETVSEYGPTFFAGKLGAPFTHRGDRPTYWPGRRTWVEQSEQDDEYRIFPADWQGSGDLRSLALADCLIRFPAGDKTYAVGDVVDVRPI